MKVFKSKFQTIEFLNEVSILLNTYTKESEDLTEDLYKAELLSYVEQIKTYKPQKTISDLRDFSYPIVPSLQEWHAKTLFPVAESVGIKKVAILLPQELFSLVSAQQTLEEDKQGKFQTKYFENEKDAYNWLKS